MSINAGEAQQYQPGFYNLTGQTLRDVVEMMDSRKPCSHGIRALFDVKW